MDQQNIAHIFLEGVRQTQVEMGINYPKTQDELFDFILTFLEGANEHKPQISNYLTSKNCLETPLQGVFAVHQLSTTVFQNHIETLFDHITFDILLSKILYVWLNDRTEDMSVTMNELNYLAGLVYSIA